MTIERVNLPRFMEEMSEDILRDIQSAYPACMDNKVDEALQRIRGRALTMKTLLTHMEKS